MNNRFLVSTGIAGVMALGLTVGAQSQDPTKPQPQTTQPKQPSTDARKVTAQGCLERDYLYSPTTAGTTAAGATTQSPTPFKLTDVEIIKAEPAGSMTGPKKTVAALHVAAAPGSNVDLDAQVNHQVEIVGTMNSKDLMSAGSTGTGAETKPTDPKKPVLMFKATSIKSIADKCQ
jgi:hypothetical protein